METAANIEIKGYREVLYLGKEIKGRSVDCGLDRAFVNFFGEREAPFCRLLLCSSTKHEQWSLRVSTTPFTPQNDGQIRGTSRRRDDMVPSLVHRRSTSLEEIRKHL